jgi:prolipoprotein diacylglyceryl transferase
MVLGIDWNVTSELIEGSPTPNKYGLLFVSGLILGFFVMKRIFKKENIDEKILDKLLMYVVIATILGARFGHVFFYGPYYDKFDQYGNLIEKGYFDHPADMFKVWEGGLASHGAAIAILIALWIFSKKVSQKPMMWLLDRVGISVAIAACFIRLGNLVNHEIIGTPTDLPWGFKFNHAGAEYLINGVQVFRHPAQLYEAAWYLIAFILLMYMYWKRNAAEKPGLLFGVFLIFVWTARFIVEFVKVGQTERDGLWLLTTGQILSIPLITVGVFLTWKALKNNEPTELNA